jgi:hypothetical protein
MTGDESNGECIQEEWDTNSDFETIIDAEEAVFGAVSDHTFTFGALASRGCRFTVYHFLLTSESDASIEELVSGVRTIVDEKSRQPARVDEETLRAHLLERSIPHLERLGVVEYDPRSSTVRYYRQPFIEEYAEHAAYQELSIDE